MTADVVIKVAAIVMGGLALLGTLGFTATIRPPRYTSDSLPEHLGWTFEHVHLHTDDGLNLAAWYIPREGGSDGTTAIVVLHGYPFDKNGVLPATSFLHPVYDLFLFDFRYLGESEGSFSTVGHRERDDLRAALTYLRERGVQQIGVWGFSMGAAVALMGLEEPGAIQAVAADSPYADLHATTLDYYSFLPVVNHAVAFWTDMLTRVTLGTSLADVSPLNAVAKSTTPVLLIHGQEDRTVPVSHFHRLKNALGEHPSAEFWLVENAGHTDAYGLEGDHYRERVLDFFRRHLIATSGTGPNVAANVQAPRLLTATRELGPDVLNGDTSGLEQHE